MFVKAFFENLILLLIFGIFSVKIVVCIKINGHAEDLMNFSKLNPYVRFAGILDVARRSDECIAYDARIFYMISGETNLTIDGKKSKLSGGNLVYIPSGTKYKFKAGRFLLAALSFDLTADFCESEAPAPTIPEKFNAELIHKCDIAPFDKVIRLEDADDERENFTEIAEIATSAEGEWQAEISAMLKLILIRLAAMTDEKALPPRMVKNLDSYIRENRRDEISNTEIGAIFGYHPFYVSNKLKECRGTTLRQYIINYRMKLAKRLLELTDKSVGEIAEEAGFKDASYFTKSFKASFGMTPKDYRNEFKDRFI